MFLLSIRLVRLALIASAAALGSSYAASAQAQVPIYRPPQPEPALEPEPEPGPVSPPSVSEVTSAVPADAPATVISAPAVETPPTDLSPSRTPPAKSNVITLPHAPTDDDDDQADDDGLEPRRKWYGWQTLVSDGISFALLASAEGVAEHGKHKAASHALAWLGSLGYEFAPSVIHFLHRNPGRGFGSMGIRLGLPLAGAIVGQAAASGCSGYRCEDSGAGAGLILGMAGAIALDAAVLAYEDAKKLGSHGVSLLPFVAVAPRQALVGLGGDL